MSKGRDRLTPQADGQFRSLFQEIEAERQFAEKEMRPMRKTTGSCCSWFATSLCLFMFVMISGGCAMPEGREAPQPAPELPTELEAKLDACLVLIPEDASEHDRRVREELCQELYGAPPSVPRGGMGSGGEELL